MLKRHFLFALCCAQGYAKDGFQVSLSGKMTLEGGSGSNDTQETHYFTGDFLKSLYSEKSITTAQTHSNNVLFLLSGSRLSTTALYEDGSTKYIANISLTADPHAPVKEAYGQINTATGVYTFGDTQGIEGIFVQGPTNIIVGSGGTGGSWSKIVNRTTFALLDMSMMGDTAHSTKVMYVTPRIDTGLFKGVKLGVSFAPNTKHSAGMAMNTAASPMKKAFSTFDLNSTALGINYLSEWDQNGALGLSAMYLTGNTRPEKVMNTSKREFQYKEKEYEVEVPSSALDRFPTRACDFAFFFKFGDWAIGAEYIINHKSGQLRYDSPFAQQKDSQEILEYPIVPFEGQTPKRYVAEKSGNGWLLNTCIGYDNRQFGLTFSWLTSSVRTGFLSKGQVDSHCATANVYALSFQYYYQSGIAPYFECGVAQIKNPDWSYVSKLIPFYTNFEYSGVKDNKGKFFLLGLKVNF